MHARFLSAALQVISVSVVSLRLAEDVPYANGDCFGAQRHPAGLRRSPHALREPRELQGNPLVLLAVRVEPL
jgi:hypothetical protein